MSCIVSNTLVLLIATPQCHLSCSSNPHIAYELVVRSRGLITFKFDFFLFWRGKGVGLHCWHCVLPPGDPQCLVISLFCMCDFISHWWLSLRFINLGDSQNGNILFLSFLLFLIFLKFIYFIYLFLASLGLHCCTWAFSSCSEWGLLFIAMHRLLITVASLVAECGL